MIDADAITQYTRDRAKLEEVLLFWVVAAGKSAHQQAAKLEQFLQGLGSWGNPELTPFLRIRQAASRGELTGQLQAVRMGQYSRIARAFEALAFSNLNLVRCTIEDLEAIPGIGPKTARCFVMHSRRNVRAAGIDTHVLKFLRAHGVPNVPRATPSSKRAYARLEQAFLDLYDRLAGNTLTVAAFDLLVWSYYADRLKLEDMHWFRETYLWHKAAA